MESKRWSWDNKSNQRLIELFITVNGKSSTSDKKMFKQISNQLKNADDRGFKELSILTPIIFDGVIKKSKQQDLVRVKIPAFRI